MKFISHRGNINGSKPELENSPNYILKALSKGYDVEVDIWLIEGQFYLGHDEPTFYLEEWLLKCPKLWFHTKSIETLHKLKYMNMHCFWHQQDDVTLTSNGYLWTYPGKTLTSTSIAVLPENLYNDWPKLFECSGICSDFIKQYKLKYTSVQLCANKVKFKL